VIAAAAVGAATGFAIAGFERLTVDVVFDHLEAWLPLVALAFLPLAGLAIASLWLHYPGRDLSRATTDEYIDAYHGHEVLGLRALGHRLVAAVATLGSGGALGLEGPSIYTGATIGSFGQRRFHRFLAGAGPNVLMVAGAAAGIAAIFKAPATGAVFALEVPYQDDIGRHLLLPALIGAVTGYVALVAVHGTTPLFPVAGTPDLSIVDLAAAAALGLACGAGAKLFAKWVRFAKRLSAQGHGVIRVALAGGAIALLFAAGRGLTGESLVLTPGYGVVTWALQPDRSVPLLLAILLLRCAATGATIAGGGLGGLFVPLVVAGALVGRVAGVVVGKDESLFLVVGIAAFLGAGYRVPLAAVIFVAESTGRPGFIVPGLIAAVVAELVMGTSSVTTHQVPSTRVSGA
jgi:CIC family chloride channel protein